MKITAIEKPIKKEHGGGKRCLQPVPSVISRISFTVFGYKEFSQAATRKRCVCVCRHSEHMEECLVWRVVSSAHSSLMDPTHKRLMYYTNHSRKRSSNFELLLATATWQEQVEEEILVMGKHCTQPFTARAKFSVKVWKVLRSIENQYWSFLFFISKLLRRF